MRVLHSISAVGLLFFLHKIYVPKRYKYGAIKFVCKLYPPLLSFTLIAFSHIYVTIYPTSTLLMHSFAQPSTLLIHSFHLLPFLFIRSTILIYLCSNLLLFLIIHSTICVYNCFVSNLLSTFHIH